MDAFIYAFWQARYWHWTRDNNALNVNKLFKGCCHRRWFKTRFRIYGQCITVAPHKRQGIQNHQQFHCLFKGLASMTTKKTSMLCRTSPLWKESADGWWRAVSPHKAPVNTRSVPMSSQMSYRRRGVSHCMCYRSHQSNSVCSLLAIVAAFWTLLNL